MAKHALLRVEPIRAKFQLPKGAKIIGYLKNRDGTDNFEYPIVRQRFLVQNKVPVLGGDGEQEWKLTPRGERYTPKYKLERKWEYREWVPAYSPQAHIERNFNFRTDPAEVERIQKQQRAQETMKELATALADEGMSVAEMMERLRGGANGEPAKRGRPRKATADA